jgi:flagellar protein FliO/FliZ
MITSSLVVPVAALLGVLALIALTHQVVRRGWIRLPIAAAGTAQRLAVVQTLALDTRRRVHLLRCDGRHIAILTGGPQDLVIGWLPEPTS